MSLPSISGTRKALMAYQESTEGPLCDFLEAAGWSRNAAERVADDIYFAPLTDADQRRRIKEEKILDAMRRQQLARCERLAKAVGNARLGEARPSIARATAQLIGQATDDVLTAEELNILSQLEARLGL